MRCCDELERALPQRTFRESQVGIVIVRSEQLARVWPSSSSRLTSAARFDKRFDIDLRYNGQALKILHVLLCCRLEACATACLLREAVKNVDGRVGLAR